MTELAIGVGFIVALCVAVAGVVVVGGAGAGLIAAGVGFGAVFGFLLLAEVE